MVEKALNLCLIVAMLLQPLAVGGMMVESGHVGGSLCEADGPVICGGCACCQVDAAGDRCCCCSGSHEAASPAHQQAPSEPSNAGKGCGEQSAVIAMDSQPRISVCLCGRQHRPLHHRTGKALTTLRVADIPLAFGDKADPARLRPCEASGAIDAFAAPRRPKFSQTHLSVWLI